MQTKIYVTNIKLVQPPKSPDPVHHTAAQTLVHCWCNGEVGSMPVKDGNSGKVGRTQSTASDSKTETQATRDRC